VQSTIFATLALASLQSEREASNSFDRNAAITGPISTPIPTDSPLPRTTPLLSNAAVLGISIGSAILLLTTLFLIFGLPYLRRVRRGRALQRAIEEVERGIEMRKTGLSEVSESKENMVLESRVEIVMDDGDDDMERERDLVDMVGRWDGWDATGDGVEEVEEWEIGRKGMSLPRREW
jgi:hypothetical protein